MLSINEQTQIETVGDKGERKNKFSVTCGKSGVVYVMSADDKRTRNEWMLDIGKVHDILMLLFGVSKGTARTILTILYDIMWGGCGLKTMPSSLLFFVSN